MAWESSARDPSVILDEMIVEAEFLVSATAGLDLDAFVKDPVLRRACERSFEILGEAAKQVPDGLRQAHAGIPWSEMARMRDLLIHGYHRVDPRIVWETVQRELGSLLAALVELRDQF